MGALDHDPDLHPIDLDIEIDPDPPPHTDVRRPEEPLRIGADQNLLSAVGGRKPHAQPIVVVMIGRRCKLLATYEPRGLAVAELFRGAGQR